MVGNVRIWDGLMSGVRDGKVHFLEEVGPKNFVYLVMSMQKDKFYFFEFP